MSNANALPQGASVVEVMRSSSEAVLDGWLKRLRAAGRTSESEAESEAGRRLIVDLFGNFAAVFASPNYTDFSRSEFADLQVRLKEVSRRQAARDRNVLAIMDLPLQFKDEVISRLPPPVSASELIAFGQVIDRLATGVVEAFTSSREDLINRQSQALLELSTPVVKLWDSVVLLPLVGVIDTARAQQMMERLLETVVQNEAQIALLDITGVPIIDTRVARHLLVTIDAVRMLGAEVIMTGISVDAAVTLTGLGIDLSRVRTKGSLKAGVAEALRLIGRTVRMVRSAAD